MHVHIAMPVYTAALDRLRAIQQLEVEVADPPELSWQCSADSCERAEVLFCRVPPSNFNAMTRLKLVQINSAGYDNWIGLGLPDRSIRLCTGTGTFDVPVAEWNIAMMINLARNVRRMIRNQETGRWERPAEFQREIRGSVLGIWGYGGIGRETARQAKAIGLTIHVLVRERIKVRSHHYCVPGTGDAEGALPDRVFTSGDERLFLSGLDFLVLAMPLTSRTRGIVGEGELRALPRRAFLLNAARGPLVCEEALLRALSENWIAGAALDTHYHYPMPPDHPLWSLPNVIMTPHISGSDKSSHYLERIWNIFSANVQRYVNREPLLNELTAEQLNGG